METYAAITLLQAKRRPARKTQTAKPVPLSGTNPLNVARKSFSASDIKKADELSIELRDALTGSESRKQLDEFVKDQSNPEIKQDPIANAVFQVALEPETSASEVREILGVLEVALADPDISVENSRPLGGGVNSTSIVFLSNGLSAVWKPDDGGSKRKLRRNVPLGTEPVRDTSAYLVDKELGHLAKVPPTVRRELEGEPGVLTFFVDGAKTATSETEVSNELLFGAKTSACNPIAVLDNVIGNVDRHTSNWMIAPSGRAFPIDHGLSFPDRNGDQKKTNYNFDRPITLNPEITAGLEKLADPEHKLSKQLEKKLGERAVGAMRRRLEGMLETGEASPTWLGKTSVRNHTGTQRGYIETTNYELHEVPGLSPNQRKALRGINASDTSRVLRLLGHKGARRNVADYWGETGKAMQKAFKPEQLSKMMNTVDLMRVSGVGPKYAELLLSAGVRSVPDLARRNPANLASKLQVEPNSMNTGEKTVAEWIRKASFMSLKVDR